MEATTNRPLRSMLVIGATLEDARDFIGDEHTANPRKLAVPDEIWSRDETLEGAFARPDTIPTGQAFDIVVVTATTWFAAQRDGVIDDAVRAAVARIEKGGTLWLEPAESCIDCGATEGGSLTHDNGQRFHVDCPNGPGGRTLGRIAKFTATPGESAAVVKR